MNNAPVGNPPAAPELPGEDPQAQAPRMPTGELVAKLDSLLARAAKTATASVDAAALEAAAGTANLNELTRQKLFTRLVNEYPAELRDEIRQKIAGDPCITKLSADRLEIDPTKFETGELHWIFRRCTGSDCDVLPQFIDEDLYNRRVAMGPDSEARKASFVMFSVTVRDEPAPSARSAERRFCLITATMHCIIDIGRWLSASSSFAFFTVLA